jgi:hypothetical protein
MSFKSRVQDSVIDLALNQVVENESLAEFVDMDVSQQLDVFKLLNEAFKDIFNYQVNNMIPVTLPYIGKLKIKEINKIALKHKHNLSVELGYNNYNDVPKDKLNEINKIVKTKTIEEYIDFKKQRDIIAKDKKKNAKPKGKHNTCKIFTFNMKSILK